MTNGWSMLLVAIFVIGSFYAAHYAWEEEERDRERDL